MKLIIILVIGFLAVSVQGEITTSSQNSIDKIKNIVDENVSDAKEVLEKFLSKEREILEKTKNITDSKIQESLERILQLIEKIEDLSKIGVKAQVCVQQHSEEMQEIENKINADIEHCIRAFKDDMIPVEREIWQTYMLLFKTILEIYDVIEECIYENENNTIQQTMCVVKEIKFFKDQVTEAYKLLKGSLESLKEMIPKVLKEFGKCVVNAELNGMKQLNAVMYSVQKCIKETV